MRILVIAAFLTVASYGNALAAEVVINFDYDYPFTVIVGTHTTYNLTVKPSKNVTLGVKIDANNIGYTAGTCHKSGNKTYASSSGDTKIFYKEIPGASAGSCSAIPAAPTSFQGFPDWPADSWTAL